MLNLPKNTSKPEPSEQPASFGLCHVMMVLATVLVATSFPIGAVITNSLNSLVLTFLRFALAAILFAPIVAWRHGLRVPRFGDFIRYSILSAFLVGFFVAMFVALRDASAVNTAAIFALLPIVTAVVSALLLRERLNVTARWALPIGALGAVLVVFQGDVSLVFSIGLGRGELLFLLGTLSLGILFGQGLPSVAVLPGAALTIAATIWLQFTSAKQPTEALVSRA